MVLSSVLMKALIFSSLRLEIILHEDYPSNPANVRFERCVGIPSQVADQLHAEIEDRSRACAQDSCGSLFEIINIAKDHVNR
jgi:hypothetical protein